ncbi:MULTISPECIES: hypothetical protein [unclassified Geodermatophilus]|uniref:hypothetical protein n=1 Tax=unclassified Geodermatophilus TaxID=2637632 RepID=UPI003EED4573
MGSDAVFFARPEGAGSPLGIAPRLAGWMSTGHPDQVHARAFLTHAERVLGPAPGGPGPLALRLDVGLPDDVRLLDQYALCRYVTPLVEWLGSHAGWDVASVWATKAPGEDSSLRAAAAEPVPPPSGDRTFVARATTSVGSAEFTAQVREQLAGQAPLAAGPVSLQLSYAVPPGCNWPGLWQPTVDALARLLGAAGDDRPEDPSDGRIVELGLHRREDGALGHGVAVTGVLRRVPGSSPDRGASPDRATHPPLRG